MKLSGHSAIVTGGASGLGAATAEALHAGGCNVALWDMNAEKGEALAKKLGGVFCQVNVADEASVKAGLDKAIAAIGAPRILVNCAGIAIGEKTIGKNGPHKLDIVQARHRHQPRRHLQLHPPCRGSDGKARHA